MEWADEANDFIRRLGEVVAPAMVASAGAGDAQAACNELQPLLDEGRSLVDRRSYRDNVVVAAQLERELASAEGVMQQLQARLTLKPVSRWKAWIKQLAFWR